MLLLALLAFLLPSQGWLLAEPQMLSVCIKYNDCPCFTSKQTIASEVSLPVCYAKVLYVAVQSGCLGINVAWGQNKLSFSQISH